MSRIPLTKSGKPDKRYTEKPKDVSPYQQQQRQLKGEGRAIGALSPSFPPEVRDLLGLGEMLQPPGGHLHNRVDWKGLARGKGTRLYDGPDGPSLLAEAIVSYMDWASNNPLHAVKHAVFQGEATAYIEPRMRAMSIQALCLYIGIGETTWYEWIQGDAHVAGRPELAPLMKAAAAAIKRQKFEGAAADLLNATIIARDLGLADIQRHEGPNGGPVQTISASMTAKEAAEAYAASLSPPDVE